MTDVVPQHPKAGPGNSNAGLAAVRGQIAAGRLDAALDALDKLLEGDPDNVDLLYTRAVALRYASRFDEARVVIDQVKLLSPNHGRAHQEEGHLERALGNDTAALACYGRALQLNPALEASCRAQLELLRKGGHTREAIRVQAVLERLQALPESLLIATDLIAQGRFGAAERLCRDFLQAHPRHVEGMRLLADIALRLGVLEDAEFLLESAVAFEPDNIQVRIDYVQVLRKRQRFAKALEQAQYLRDLAPDNPQFVSLFAIESLQTGAYDTALAAFDQVLKQVPGDAATLTSKGHALKTFGRTPEAVQAYQAAITRHPLHGEAYHALANLKTYRFDAQELERMHEVEDDRNLGFMDRVYLCFALGKAHEDLGEFETSFRYYERGNSLKRAQSGYSAERMHEDLVAQHRVCTRAFFDARRDWGHPAPDPVFIVGLPRAGSTLLEQILSSHSRIDGTMELPNVLSLSQRLRRQRRLGGYPNALERLSSEEIRGFGEAYIEDTRIHRSGADFFIDKMPNNFRHIGLIRLMLPNARIIDSRRNAMACCFSGFKQLFAEGQEFTYSLQDIGRYYRDYVELMEHWERALPGHVLRVMHEDVVEDLERQVRRILECLQLPFEDACLRYYETERSVRTPSSEQVRQPIFSDSVEQWRHYEPWLGTLKTALGAELVV
jgi:tetratricopeptide (TPR) repeat protein